MTRSICHLAGFCASGRNRSTKDSCAASPLEATSKLGWWRGSQGRQVFRATRRGITILEVLLSVAILIGAMTAIGGLLSNGADSAIQAKWQTEAVLRAESKLAEVISGAVPLESVNVGTFPEDTDQAWSWSLSIDSGPHADLLALELTVDHTNGAGIVDATFTLNSYVRDPEVYLDTSSSSSSSSATSSEE